MTVIDYFQMAALYFVFLALWQHFTGNGCGHLRCTVFSALVWPACIARIIWAWICWFTGEEPL